MVAEANLRLCLPCFANENLDRYKRGERRWPSGGLATG